MKRIALVTMAVSLAGIVGVGVAVATTSSGVNRKDLATGSAPDGVKIEAAGPTDVAHKFTTIDAGGTTGWHSHPGTEVATVAAGIANYYNTDADCALVQAEPGTTLVIPAGSVHLVENEGTAAVEIYVVSFNTPGEPAVKPEPEPACAAPAG